MYGITCSPSNTTGQRHLSLRLRRHRLHLGGDLDLERLLPGLLVEVQHLDLPQRQPGLLVPGLDPVLLGFDLSKSANGSTGLTTPTPVREQLPTLHLEWSTDGHGSTSCAVTHSWA